MLYFPYSFPSSIQRVFTLLIPLSIENRSLHLKCGALTPILFFSYWKFLVAKVVSLTSSGRSCDCSPFT